MLPTLPLTAAISHKRKTFFQLINYHHRALTIGLLLLGVLLRLFHYLDNRSFWIDELYLNSSIIKMSMGQLLTQPMDYEQKAPLGYLVLVKSAVSLFGSGERALRLVSLLCGLGTLWVFVPVARYFLQPWTALAALGVLALGEPFLYHSTEAKQYSTELFAAVLALYLALTFQHARRPASLVLWGLSGGALVWFSYSSIFVLASIAIIISAKNLLAKNWKLFFYQAFSFGMWLVSFSLVYYFFLRKYVDSGWLKNFFDVMYGAYLPLPPTSLKDIHWLAYTQYMLLERDLGMLFKFGALRDYTPLQTLLRLPLVPLLLELVGGLVLLRRRPYWFGLLVLPIALVLVASSLRIYPFHERFILFLAPFYLLLIAYGAERLVALVPTVAREQVAALLLVLLLLPPSWNALQFSFKPSLLYKKEYNREAMLYVNERYQPGDAVYVYWSMNHAYKYYKPAYQLKYEALGREDLRQRATDEAAYYQQIQAQLGSLAGKKRLWLIYNPELRNNIGDYPNQTPKWYHKPNFSPGAALEAQMTRRGAVLTNSFNRHSIAVRLYRLP